jgi:uncharacterized protein with HEPN domain
MLDAARRAVEFTRDVTLEDFLADEMRGMAVERTLEILGEAARRVSDGFRASHPEIPWRDLVGQRNVLAHDYGDIDQGRVWEAATQEAPQLVVLLEAILPPPP